MNSPERRPATISARRRRRIAEVKAETLKRRNEQEEKALEGKRELNAEETARLKPLWKKLVRMFHPDLHEHDPEKRKNSERVDGKSDDRIMDGRIIFGE